MNNKPLGELPTAILEQIATCVTLRKYGRRRIGELSVTGKLASDAIMILFIRDAEEDYPYTQ